MILYIDTGIGSMMFSVGIGIVAFIIFIIFAIMLIKFLTDWLNRH